MTETRQPCLLTYLQRRAVATITTHSILHTLSYYTDSNSLHHSPTSHSLSTPQQPHTSRPPRRQPLDPSISPYLHPVLFCQETSGKSTVRELDSMPASTDPLYISPPRNDYKTSSRILPACMPDMQRVSKRVWVAQQMQCGVIHAHTHRNPQFPLSHG